MSIVLFLTLSGLLTPPDASGVVLTTGDVLSSAPKRNVVYTVELASGAVRPVYEAMFNMDGTTRELGVHGLDHPERSKLALVGVVDSYSGYKATDLIDLEGHLTKRIENTVSAVFLDDEGARIAYTTGVDEEDSKVFSTGTWVLDVATNKEEKVCDEGFYLERGRFDGNLYINTSTEGLGGYLYNLGTKQLEKSDLAGVRFSPGGKYYWACSSPTSAVEIIKRGTGQAVSCDFELMSSSRHGMPLYWMSDRVIMLPHFMDESEDYLLFVESGKTLKVPGRLLHVSEDEKFVFYCKPGQVVDKMAMRDLEVLYQGKDDTAPPQE